MRRTRVLLGHVNRGNCATNVVVVVVVVYDCDGHDKRFNGNDWRHLCERKLN